MNAFDQDCFLFVPNKDDQHNGILYSLLPAESCAEEAVVLLPYSNPTVKKPEPLYFTVTAQEHISLPATTSPSTPLTLRALITKEDYLKQIARLKEHIQRGDIYEINYCVAFEGPADNFNPLHVFHQLRTLTMAPYSMLMRIGADYILCASPELFLKRSGTTLLTKPIKGTAPRSKSAEEDELLKSQLQSSLKERTENVMAVDVARNDLSQIASRGSVQVNALYTIESFATVHQMVSTVSCEIAAETGLAEIIDATFPMASMTGAPKRRAMDLCSETEAFDRNFYSGALGHYNKGDFEFGVLIRSIFYNAVDKKVRIAVGGAITHLCDAETEYAECQLKARSLLLAMNAKVIE